MILDTNFLGALDAGDAGAKALATELESDGLPARIPTPVVFEVFYGIEGAETRTSYYRGTRRCSPANPGSS